jgi:C-type lectin domain family 4 protein A
MNFVCLSAPQRKNTSQKSCHKFSKVLFTSLIIYFLLLTILFSGALISKYKYRGTSKQGEK